jgi:hypothetical protein
MIVQEIQDILIVTDTQMEELIAVDIKR